jgi:hypothetical protein
MFYDKATLMLVGGCGNGQCNGQPISNYPHDGTDSPQSDVDRSVERLPGGAAGNGQDTNADDVDFTDTLPAQPRNTASPPAP